MKTKQMSVGPSDRLLRTLAAVPVSSSVLDLGCGSGRYTEAFLRLGFPVHACDPRPAAVGETRTRIRELIDEDTAETCVGEATLDGLDGLDATFNWVIGDEPEAFLKDKEDLTTLLQKVESLLSPGGYFYLTLPASAGTDPASSEDLDFTWSAQELDVDDLDTTLVESRPPDQVEGDDRVRLHAIYRRVIAQVPT